MKTQVFELISLKYTWNSQPLTHNLPKRSSNMYSKPSLVDQTVSFGVSISTSPLQPLCLSVSLWLKSSNSAWAELNSYPIKHYSNSGIPIALVWYKLSNTGGWNDMSIYTWKNQQPGIVSFIRAASRLHLVVSTWAPHTPQPLYR